MKRFLGVIVAGGVLILLIGAATAHWGGDYGPGRGRMGFGMLGGHGMGWRGGPTDCPGWSGTTASQVTEERAKELAQKYADQYLPGFKVERVLPSSGMHHMMYSIELKNPQGELRTFHINPFGNVIPYGGPWRHGS